LIEKTLGVVFLQGLDKLAAYNVVSELRKLFKNYGIMIGGGGMSNEIRRKGGAMQYQNIINVVNNFSKQMSSPIILNDNQYRAYPTVLK
jgi:hypothetical protein